MHHFSWQQVIRAVVVGLLLCGAAFVWYYIEIILPAQQSAAEEQLISALEAHVRAKVCSEASTSTDEAHRRFCAAQP